jgi:hypothetical protein
MQIPTPSHEASRNGASVSFVTVICAVFARQVLHAGASPLTFIQALLITASLVVQRERSNELRYPGRFTSQGGRQDSPSEGRFTADVADEHQISPYFRRQGRPLQPQWGTQVGLWNVGSHIRCHIRYTSLFSDSFNTLQPSIIRLYVSPSTYLCTKSPGSTVIQYKLLLHVTNDQAGLRTVQLPNRHRRDLAFTAPLALKGRALPLDDTLW